MNQLFITPPKVDPLEKTAGTPVMLSEDNMKWGQEITSEVFRTFPFLSTMDVRTEVVRADPNTGVGVGRVTVRRAPLRLGMPSPEGTPVILPFVVRGYELVPLDIATDGKNYFPASQRRIESILMQPNLGVTGPENTELVSDTSYFTDLIPPGRSYHGAYPGISQVKVAGMSLWDEVLGSAKLAHVDRIRNSMDTDCVSILRNSIPVSLAKLAHWEPRNEKVDQDEVFANMQPTVVQFEKISSHRVRVSYANRNAFVKMAQDIPASEAEQYMPEGGAEEMAAQGYTTMGTEVPVLVPSLPKHDPTSPVKNTGTYTVFTEDGSQLTGWATSNVLDFDGNPRGMTVFSNGAVSALQPAIAGVQTGSGHLPPCSRRPAGAGYFVLRNDGDISLYGPVVIQGQSAMPDGSVSFSAVDAMTNIPAVIQPTPGILRVAPMGEGMYGIPQAIEWLPIAQQIKLLMPGEIMKTAALGMPGSRIDVTANGGSYTLSGPPVDDLEPMYRQGISKQAAAFTLVAAGLFPASAHQLLKEADGMYGAVASAYNLRKVASGAKALQREREAINAELSKVAGIQPKFFVKEAANIAAYLQLAGTANGPQYIAQQFPSMFKLAAPTLPHQETVDSILSLGMVNPESVSVFVRQKPKLEEALSTLCTLLLFARIGAPGIPEISLERTISGFEETLDAVDMLPFSVQ